MHKYIITILILLIMTPCFSQDASNIPAQNLPYNQIKNIITYGKTVKNDITQAQSTKNSMKDFVIAHERFSQSNIIAAYNEYEKLTRNANNDFLRIILAYELCEKGYFTLVQDNFNNISDKQMWEPTTTFLKTMYFPKNLPAKEDELKLAEYYTDIFYNNLPFETSKTLSKDNEILKKTDYSYLVLAQAYLESKEPSKALNSINKALSINKNNLNYKKYKAQILSEEKRYDEALKLTNEIIKQSSPSIITKEQNKTLQSYIYAQSKKDVAQSKYYLAKYLFEINDTKRALREINYSLYAKKKNSPAYTLLADIYLSENNIFKASENYDKALALNKKNLQTLIGKGNVEFFWDDYDKAMEYYNTVLKKDKNNEDAILNIAICYLMKKDTTNSKIWIDKLLTINPNNYKAYFMLSFLDSSKSEEYLKKTLAINPLTLDAWGNLAKIALDKNDIKQAKNYLYPLEYLSYKNFMYYYCMGEINRIEGNHEKARENYLMAITLYKDYAPAKQALLLPELNKEKDVNGKI